MLNKLLVKQLIITNNFKREHYILNKSILRRKKKLINLIFMYNQFPYKMFINTTIMMMLEQQVI